MTPRPAVAPPPVNGQHLAVATANGSQPPASEPALAPRAAEGVAGDTSEIFKNDPLIQKALKIFEGEIRSVQGPA